MGPDTILSKNEELLLVKWVIAMGERKLPVTKDQLLDSVQRIITAGQRSTPFTLNRPGKKWYSAFLKRHSILAERVAENMSAARVGVSEEQIRGWFTEIKDYLTQNNLSEMLDDPTKIFNTDESAFFLSPKPGRVLVKRGTKNVYLANGDEKENLTVLLTANAAGKLAPPMIVYSYNRIPANIAKNVPETWAIGKSESGWMCGETFFEYVANVFNPWLIEEGIQKPVLLFVDGHKSHLTLHLSNFCSENGIEIIALYPNSTHILQPMDIAVFRPLKLFYRKAVVDWKMQNNGNKLKKEDFAPVLKIALESITVDCIKNGFRGGGLHPFGPEYIDYSKMKSQNEPKQSAVQEQQQFLNCLESQIIKTFGQDKLSMFNKFYFEGRNVLENMALEEDLNLYIIWAHNKQTTTVPLDHSAGSHALPACLNHTVASTARPESSASKLSSADARQSYCRPNPTESIVPADDAGPSTSRPESSASTVFASDARLSQCRPEPTSPTVPTNNAVPSTSRHEYSASTVSSADARQSQCRPESTRSTLSADDVVPSISRCEYSASTVPSADIRQSQYRPEPTRSTVPADHAVASTSPPDPSASKVSSADARQSQCRQEPTRSSVSVDHAFPSTSRPESFALTMSDFHSESATLPVDFDNVRPFNSHTPKKTGTDSTTHKNYDEMKKVQDISSSFTVNASQSNSYPNRSGCTPEKNSLSNALDKVPSAVTSLAWQKYHQKRSDERVRKLKEKELRAKKRLEKKLWKLDTEKNKKKKSNIKKKIQDSSSSDDTDVDIQYQGSDESEYNVELDESGLNVKENTSQMSQNENNRLNKLQKKRKRILDSDSDSELPLAKSKSKAENLKMSLKKGEFVIVTYEGEYFPGKIENTDRERYEISTMKLSTGNSFRWPKRVDKIWYPTSDIVEIINPPVPYNNRGFFKVQEMLKYLPDIYI
ncbi:unnamed protein product [Euphydryas editha]|uniref:HTH CENPB-type domain-containing protein n=1 Tax=Euphydryas editha TaxID=104508 RepID=A0AAU9UHN0_EUPED|nr:unnamed protein product [Euphydryas editha]